MLTAFCVLYFCISAFLHFWILAFIFIWSCCLTSPQSKHAEEVDRWTDRNDEGGSSGGNSRFAAALAKFNERNDRKTYKALELDADIMRSMNEEEIFIVRSPCGADGCKFYKNVQPTVQIKLSKAGMFFHRMDYEQLYLTEGHCPINRKPDAEMEGNADTSNEHGNAM